MDYMANCWCQKFCNLLPTSTYCMRFGLDWVFWRFILSVVSSVEFFNANFSLMYARRSVFIRYSSSSLLKVSSVNNIVVFSFRKTTLQLVSPLWDLQMSWSEFVCIVLETFGTFWKIYKISFHGFWLKILGCYKNFC